MRISREREHQIMWLFYGALVLALAFLFPLAGDDWDWAVASGFPTLNGRYLGNLIVMLLTRHTWLRTLVKGIALVLITWGVSGFSSRRSWLAMVALMAVNRYMFIQVYQWTSGFVNFTLPVALFVFTLWAILTAVKTENRTHRLILLGAISLSAMAAQLFAEHTTLGTTAFTALVLIWLQYKKLPGRGPVLSACLGYAAGMLIMFLNPAYWGQQEGAHPMPGLSEIVENIWTNFNGTIAPHLLAYNMLLLLVLAAVLLVILSTSAKRDRLAGALQWVLAACTGLLVFIKLNTPLSGSEGVQIVRSLTVLVFLIVMPVVVLRYLPRCRRRTEAVLAMLAALCFALPLLAVEPIGARCLFASYAALVFAICALVAYFQEEKLFSLAWGTVSRASAAVTLAVFAMYFGIYGVTYAENREREDAVYAQLEEGVDELWVKTLTYGDDYTQGINLHSAWPEDCFRRYYGVPNDCTIVVSATPEEG